MFLTPVYLLPCCLCPSCVLSILSPAALEVAYFFCTEYMNKGTDTTGHHMIVLLCVLILYVIHACIGNVFRHGICVCWVGVCVLSQ